MTTRAQIPQGWIDACSAEMKRRGLSKAELARQTKSDPSDITRLFQGRRRWTKAAPAVAALLGVPLPDVPALTPREMEWMDLGNRLHAASSDRYADAVQMVRDALDLEEKKAQVGRSVARFLTGDRSDRGDKHGA